MQIIYSFNEFLLSSLTQCHSFELHINRLNFGLTSILVLYFTNKIILYDYNL